MRRKKDPRGDLIVGRARTQGLNVERMSQKAGISLSTMYKRIRLPGTLTIDELRNIDKADEGVHEFGEGDPEEIRG